MMADGKALVGSTGVDASHLARRLHHSTKEKSRARTSTRADGNAGLANVAPNSDSTPAAARFAISIASQYMSWYMVLLHFVPNRTGPPSRKRLLRSPPGPQRLSDAMFL